MHNEERINMKKKKEAILESKCILEQTEGSMVNYGGAYSNFALAEKSGSFLDKKKRCLLYTSDAADE